MTSQTPALVHVVAFEYVNPGPDAGGGGFDWYHTAADADSAFANPPAALGAPESLAFFRFDVQVSDRGNATDEIDSDLAALCAAATVRRVGAQVLAYWRANGFNMGDATQAANPPPQPST